MGVVFNRIFQMLVDIVIGFAMYFGLKAFAPNWSDNTVIVLTLIVMAAFAEAVEIRLKK